MIYIAADHNGMALKRYLCAFCTKRRIAFVDCGPLRRIPNDDYPEIATRVVRLLKKDRAASGVLICGSGNGMAMAANRFRFIRAALAPSPVYAKKAREDERANVLVLPAWWMTKATAVRTFAAWIGTSPSAAPRHTRRILALSRLGNG